GLLLVVGVAGLFASFSRAGISLGVAALAWTALAAGRFRTVRTRVVVVALLLGAASVPLAGIGADRLLARFGDAAFDLQDSGGRLTVWGDTRRMIGAFPICGTGLGTFAEIYPRYRSPEVRKFYSHAHSDPLQLVAETGAAGALLALGAAVPLLVVVVGALRGRKGTVGIGFAAGFVALSLHSSIDFNFHLPANAGVAAIIAGTLLGLPWIDPD
ncbi:MAG TPA: O-antigen ligase family protein, partial [Candidatus Polarisedimenticolaceae bacterium]|nr:O-antigen ligase family protein [Candidatus Polarisedimenticolaceae bacterium]